MKRFKKEKDSQRRLEEERATKHYYDEMRAEKMSTIRERKRTADERQAKKLRDELLKSKKRQERVDQNRSQLALMHRTANDDLGFYGEDKEDDEDGSPSGTNRNNARIFSNSVGKTQGRS